MKFTAVYEKVSEGYIAWVEEIPGVNTQGKTLSETKENLDEAIELVLDSYRRITRKATRNRKLKKETIAIG